MAARGRDPAPGVLLAAWWVAVAGGGYLALYLAAYLVH